MITPGSQRVKRILARILTESLQRSHEILEDFVRDLNDLCILQQHFFLLYFQLEKYQDVIKTTEEFETQLLSLGMNTFLKL